MTINEFHALTKEKRIYQLEKAVQLSSINFEKHALSLFHLDSFYIEVIYDYERRKIDQLLAFDNLKLLDIYLHELEIEEIEHSLAEDYKS